MRAKETGVFDKRDTLLRHSAGDKLPGEDAGSGAKLDYRRLRNPDFTGHCLCQSSPGRGDRADPKRVGCPGSKEGNRIRTVKLRVPMRRTKSAVSQSYPETGAAFLK